MAGVGVPALPYITARKAGVSGIFMPCRNWYVMGLLKT